MVAWWLETEKWRIAGDRAIPTRPPDVLFGRIGASILATGLGKPLLPLAVIRHHPLQPVPEGGIVARFEQVNQLMGDDVFDQRRRQADHRQWKFTTPLSVQDPQWLPKSRTHT